MKRVVSPFLCRFIVALAVSLGLAAASPGLAFADDSTLLVLLPEERADEFEAALRLELAGQPFALVTRVVPAGHAPTPDEARHAADSQPADIVLWVDTSSGPLVPPVARTLVVADDAERGARLPDALDVQDPAVFATIAISLLDAAPLVALQQPRDGPAPAPARPLVADSAPAEAGAAIMPDAANSPGQGEAPALSLRLQLGAGLLDGDGAFVFGFGLGLFQSGFLGGYSAARFVWAPSTDRGVFLLSPISLGFRPELGSDWGLELDVGLLTTLSAEGAGFGYSATVRPGLNLSDSVAISLSLSAEQWILLGNGETHELVSATLGFKVRF